MDDFSGVWSNAKISVALKCGFKKRNNHITNHSIFKHFVHKVGDNGIVRNITVFLLDDLRFTVINASLNLFFPFVS